MSESQIQSSTDKDLFASGAYRTLSIESLIDALRKEMGEGPAGKLDALELLVDELRKRQADLEDRNRELDAAQRQLERHRDAFIELYEDAPVGYVTLNASGQILQANRTLCNLLGLGADALIGRLFSSLVIAEDRARYFRHQRLLLNAPIRREQSLVTRVTLGGDADPLHVRLHCTRTADDIERAPVLRIAVVDVSAAEHAERALRRHRDYAERLLDTAHVMVVLLDADGRIEHINRYTERLTAYSLRDVKGCCWADLFVYPADRNRARAGFSLSGHAAHGWSLTLDLRTRGDTRRSIEWRNTPMVEDHQLPGGGVLCVGVDVTQLRDLRRREREQLTTLAHLGRLTLIEQVSAQIAHELNQPLAAISSYCHVMQRRLNSDQSDRDELSGILKKIAAQAERSARTIQHLRRFASRRVPDRLPQDLNSIARNALALLENELASTIEHPILALSGPSAMVRGDGLLLEQVAVNLLRNSLDALKLIPEPRRRLRLVTLLSDGKSELRIEDTGPGLSDADLQRVFRGFYTTKPEGLGLGLLICRRIVEMHEGTLKGTRFGWPDGHSGMRFSVTLPSWDESRNRLESV